MLKRSAAVAVTAIVILLLLSPAALGKVTLYSPGEATGVSVYRVEGNSMSLHRQFAPGEVEVGGALDLADFPEGVLPLAVFDVTDGELFCAGRYLVMDGGLSAGIASAFTGAGPGTLETKIRGILPLIETAAAGHVYLKASHAHIGSTGYGQSLNDGAVLCGARLYATGDAPALALPAGFSLFADHTPLPIDDQSRILFNEIADNTELNLTHMNMGLSHTLTLVRDNPPRVNGIVDGIVYKGTVGGKKALAVTLIDPDPGQEFILTLKKGDETIFSGSIYSDDILERDLTYTAGTTPCSLTVETRCNGIPLISETLSFTMQGFESGASDERIANVSAGGSLSSENIHFTILNEDAASAEGIGFGFEFNGTDWNFADTAALFGVITALDKPEGYQNVKIIASDAFGMEINLDGDLEKTADLLISFDVPAREGDTLSFDIINFD